MNDLNYYRLIIVIPAIYRICSKQLVKWIVNYSENKFLECQSEFKKGCSYLDFIFVVKQIIEKGREFNQLLYIVFINIKKPYDSIILQNLLYILEKVYNIN